MSKYQKPSFILLFLSLCTFWYAFQFNAYNHLESLKVAEHFIQLIAIFSDSTTNDALITEQGFHFTGMHSQQLMFAISIALSLVACFISIIHRIKSGQNKLFFPIAYLGIFLSLFIGYMAFKIGVFYA